MFEGPLADADMPDVVNTNSFRWLRDPDGMHAGPFGPACAAQDRPCLTPRWPFHQRHGHTCPLEGRLAGLVVHTPRQALATRPAPYSASRVDDTFPMRTCVRLDGGPGTRRVPTGQVVRRARGLHIKHVGDIPVTVKVTWTDGTEGEVNAWTSQWTHTHVCVCRETAPVTRSGCEPQTSGGADRGRCRKVRKW